MGRNILIVDDCGTTRRILSYMVKGAGYTPVLASNGLEALEKLAVHEISLVLTDMNMPGMDGIELTSQIKGDERYRDLPVIMLTTEAGEDDKKLGMEAGVDLYITKPVTSERLVSEIKKFLPDDTKGGKPCSVKT